MTDSIRSSVSRRSFLCQATAGALSAGVVGTAEATAQDQPAPAGEGSSAAPIRAFHESLTAEQRRRMCFEWDHRGFTGLPLRLHVTNNWDISPAAIASFTKDQQRLLDDILASVLNPPWPDRLKQQARDDTGRRDGSGWIGGGGEDSDPSTLPGPDDCSRVVLTRR